MNKFIILLLIAVSLFVSFGLASTSELLKDQSVLTYLTATPTPSAEIEKIELDRNKVSIPCHPSVRPKEKNCGDNTSIKVRVNAKNPRNVALSYEYTVSTGRIVGQGENVTWDSAGVQPGVYTITVGINDGSEVRYVTKTESITVERCDCVIADLSCPSVSISTPHDSVKAGETITFTANLSNPSSSDIEYN